MDSKSPVPVHAQDIDGGTPHVPVHAQDVEGRVVPQSFSSDAPLHPHVLRFTGMGIALLLVALLALATAPHH